MKVLVIFVDGAEYTLLDKHEEMKGFRQAEYGFHSVPHLSTSILFKSFLTGMTPEKLLYYKSHINRYWRKLFKKDLINPNNIFDTVPRSIGIEIPSYTKGKICSNRLSLDMAKYDKEFIEKEVHDEFDNTLLKLKQLKFENFDLIMVHFGILDLYQHYAPIYGEEKILEQYKILDEHLKEIQSKFKGIVFVLSDHGLIGGNHQPYGFFSINNELQLKNYLKDLSWTDYRSIIEHLVDGRVIPSRSLPSYLPQVYNLSTLNLSYNVNGYWKLIKTIKLLKKYEYKQLHVVNETTLEKKVLCHILQHNRIKHEINKGNLFISTQKWSDGGSSYMAYQLLGKTLSPFLHWTNKDFITYAKKMNLKIPNGYSELNKIDEETIKEKLKRLGYF